MTEKEKMLAHVLYDANYDKQLIEERTACKLLCQTYNQLPVDDFEQRSKVIHQILGKCGQSVNIEPGFWCDYGWNIEVGECFYANHGLVILDEGRVTFGNHVFIGPSCGFYTARHPMDVQRRDKGLEYALDITVEDHVWIGAGVHVLAGVTIGEGSIIGAGSVVTKDIPAYCVAAGNPCRVIRQIQPFLKTRRLLLRPWEDNDAYSLFTYAKDPSVGPIAGWPPHQNLDESKEIIRTVFHKEETYAICLKEENIPIGAIDLKMFGNSDLAQNEKECELGYWLGKPYWGQGLVPEAAMELLRHAFIDLGMEKVWCGYYDGNIKSKRVQEKCGFIYQWTSYDVEVPLMHETRTGHVSRLTRKEWFQKGNIDR